MATDASIVGTDLLLVVRLEPGLVVEGAAQEVEEVGVARGVADVALEQLVPVAVLLVQQLAHPRTVPFPRHHF